MLAAALMLAVGALAALIAGLWATRTLGRRRRGVMRQGALVDPVTGLGSRLRLVRDLRLLSRDRAAAGTHLLVMFELPRLATYEIEHEAGPPEELFGRLGRKLANAVGRAGRAYSPERGRFVVLARVGRVSEQVVIRAATAALYEQHPAVEGLTRVSTLFSPADAINPRDVLGLLEALGELRPMVVSEASVSSHVGVHDEASREAASAHVGVSDQASGEAALSRVGVSDEALGEGDAPRVDLGHEASREAIASRVGLAQPTAVQRVHEAVSAHERRGVAGPMLLERELSHRIARRTSHNGRNNGRAAPARPLDEPADEEAHDAIAAARRRDVPRRNPPPRWMPYLRVSTRFKLSVLCGIAWMCLSAWLAWPWINELAHSISLPAALFLITGIALIPGYLNLQLVTSLLVDHPAPIDFDFDYPGLTLLVAAYNEEGDIAQTLSYVLEQDYPGRLSVIVIDDGSVDETVAIARGFARLDDRVRVVEVPHGGKALALNAGLGATRTPLVATIDGDTLLMPGALRRIVSRMLLSTADTVAVAGSVMVRNSRANVVTAAQTWDYFLGIGSIKRQQALLQATLVAQGAFSVYDAEALRSAGGWPDCIGEDIVMTWALLDRGGRTTYEPSAVAFTEVPVTLRSLARQRRRWARGMIEGLRIYGRALLRQRLPYVHAVIADALFPYLDLTFTLAFIPGIVLAAFGDYAIVGPATLAVLPLNVVIAGIMYRRQRTSFAQAGLHVRQNVIGFFAYLLIYQLVMSPVSVAGYLEELFQTARRW